MGFWHPLLTTYSLHRHLRFASFTSFSSFLGLVHYRRLAAISHKASPLSCVPLPNCSFSVSDNLDSESVAIKDVVRKSMHYSEKCSRKHGYFLGEVFSVHGEHLCSKRVAGFDLTQLQTPRSSALLKIISDENFYSSGSLWNTATQEYPYGFTSLSSHVKPIVHSSGLDLQ